MTDTTDLAILRSQELLELMPEIAEVAVETDEGAALEIARAILGSRSLDEALSDGEADGALTLLGVPLRLNGFRLRPSDMEGEGPPVFAVIDAHRLDTGERTVVTSGALNVLAQLIFAGRGGLFPFEAQFRQSAKGKPGRTPPYRLVHIVDADGHQVIHKQAK